jgi:hypothetical protein
MKTAYFYLAMTFIHAVCLYGALQGVTEFPAWWYLIMTVAFGLFAVSNIKKARNG